MYKLFQLKKCNVMIKKTVLLFSISLLLFSCDNDDKNAFVPSSSTGEISKKEEVKQESYRVNNSFYGIIPNFTVKFLGGATVKTDISLEEAHQYAMSKNIEFFLYFDLEGSYITSEGSMFVTNKATKRTMVIPNNPDYFGMPDALVQTPNAHVYLLPKVFSEAYGMPYNYFYENLPFSMGWIIN